MAKKNKHGEFVLLTNDEYQKLIKKFGKDGTEQRIEDLNIGIGSKGYKYKSHYYTILSWDRKDKKANKLRLLPIIGKTCYKKGCKMPAVYKDESGDYAYYWCGEHMPKEVKDKYGS